MCFAIPVKVLEVINDNQVRINYKGFDYTVITVDEKPLVGDYVLVHAGYVIKILSQDQGLSILKLLDLNTI